MLGPGSNKKHMLFFGAADVLCIAKSRMNWTVEVLVIRPTYWDAVRINRVRKTLLYTRV